MEEQRYSSSAKSHQRVRTYGVVCLILGLFLCVPGAILTGIGNYGDDEHDISEDEPMDKPFR